MKGLFLPLAELWIVGMLLTGVVALEGILSISASLIVAGESWDVAVQLAKSDSVLSGGSWENDENLARPVWGERFADQLAFVERVTKQQGKGPDHPQGSPGEAGGTSVPVRRRSRFRDSPPPSAQELGAAVSPFSFTARAGLPLQRTM